MGTHMTSTETPESDDSSRSGRRSHKASHVRVPVWVLTFGVIVGLGLIGYIAVDSDRDGEGETPNLGGFAPAATTADPGEVLDLLDIIDADGIRIEAHGDGTATVFVTTTIDVACAVSYGSTTELGTIATDADMAGAAHSNHHPLLLNLEENTDYFYKLNAIGPEGELYTTDLRSFTNGALTSAAPGPNIAGRATVVETSSDFSSAFAGAYAIDGDRSTEWSSRGDGDGAYIVLDFGAAVDISGIGFRTREMSNGTSITESFTVTVDDGPQLGLFAAGIGLAVAEFESSGRIVRVDVETSTGGNTGAIEIEVYSSSAS